MNAMDNGLNAPGKHWNYARYYVLSRKSIAKYGNKQE